MRLGTSLQPLHERPFRLLWLARTTSSLGDSLVPVATSFAVLEIGSASDLGIVLGAYMAGRMVFMLAGGVWADRIPRRALMIAADAVRAVVQTVIALAFLTDAIEVWQLVVSSTVFGIASAFFGPASTGLVPQIQHRTSAGGERTARPVTKWNRSVRPGTRRRARRHGRVLADLRDRLRELHR